MGASVVEFLVIGAPRSMTTWCSNWLTTDTTLCLHGLSANKHYSEWDSIQSDKVLGVSDTTICMFPRWVNAHSARKVIIHRDKKEVDGEMDWNLDRIRGVHIHIDELLNNPKPIYEYLLERPFDKERHALLHGMQINRMSDRIEFDKETLYRLQKELHE